MANMFNPAAVDTLQQTVAQLVVQLGNYIQQPESERDEHDTGLVRQIRIISASLSGAVDMLSRIPPTSPTASPATMAAQRGGR